MFLDYRNQILHLLRLSVANCKLVSNFVPIFLKRLMNLHVIVDLRTSIFIHRMPSICLRLNLRQAHIKN